jgi:hypothetical protein
MTGDREGRFCIAVVESASSLIYSTGQFSLKASNVRIKLEV